MICGKQLALVLRVERVKEKPLLLMLRARLAMLELLCDISLVGRIVSNASLLPARAQACAGAGLVGRRRGALA